MACGVIKIFVHVKDLNKLYIPQFVDGWWS